MKAEIGDMIRALGMTAIIGEILYQDCYDGIFDIEFIDTQGVYRHWKQEYDGGRLIKKAQKKTIWLLCGTSEGSLDAPVAYETEEEARWALNRIREDYEDDNIDEVQSDEDTLCSFDGDVYKIYTIKV